MIDRKTSLLLLLLLPIFSHAQDRLSGSWTLPDGTCVYEFRTFEDGHLEARLVSTTRKQETPGRVVIDHLEPHGNSYKAVIHSAGKDVPREVLLKLRDGGNTLDLDIPRILSPVHIQWMRVSDAQGHGGPSSTLSLNE